MFAEILIENLPQHIEKDIYTYQLPMHLIHLQLGVQVLVPFGSQKRVGFILKLTHSPPNYPVKEVLEIVGHQYFETEYLEWLQWISQYYMSSMSQVVSVAIPKRVTGKIKTLIKPKLPAVELLKALERNRYSDELIDFSKYALSGIPQLKSLKGAQRKFKLVKSFLKQLDDFFEVVKVVSQPPKPKTQLSVTYIKTPQKVSQRQNEILRRLQQLGGDVPLTLLCRKLNTTSPTLRKLESIGALTIGEQRISRLPHSNLSTEFEETDKELTGEQKEALYQLNKGLESRAANPAILLHGVTGSGKTEVYMGLLDRLQKNGEGAIVLVPEISLTPMMLKRFRARFGDNVALIHSGLSEGEFLDEWHRIKTGATQIVIGARSAVFAPVKCLKVIILDEEHDGSYKQDNFLRYDTRLIALERMKRQKGLLVLGSATPRIESYYAAQTKKIGYIQMSQRVHKRPMPPVHIVDMRKERELGNLGVFSHALQEQMKRTLERGEQMILLLNRRGFASSMLCRACGYSVSCPQCDVSMTYHRNQGLKCHYCDYNQPVVLMCPECRCETLQPFGLGTQKLEALTQQLFPGISVIRMDRDTTGKKDAHFEILKQFEEDDIDVLIGTQMVAKGLDFHRVTLVGILAADLALNLPDFRAGEKTFQLLTQAAGRAGRGDLKSQIILQTYAPEHPAIQSSLRHDFVGFYEQEIDMRRQFNYPPFVILIKIVFVHAQLEKAFEVAEIWKTELSLNSSLEILGPVPSPIAKIQNLYRVQMLIKTTKMGALRKKVKHLRRLWDSKLFRLNIDINPMSML